MSQMVVPMLCVLSGLVMPLWAEELIRSPTESPAGASPGFQRLDTEGDGTTQAESLPGIQVSDAFPAPLRAIYQGGFAQADQDGDGWISQQELRESASLREAVATKQWVTQTAQPQFRQLDANGDAYLSPDELLNGIPDDQQLGLRHEFLIVDFDEDGRLSFEEYLCLPSVASPSRRGVIPDPIEAQAEAQISAAIEILAALAGTDRGAAPLKDWQSAVEGQWYAAYAHRFDRNGDGLILREEVREALEIAFGIRCESGERLRRENGRLFIWHTLFNVWDVNRDGKLSPGEFVPKFWRGPQAAEALFREADIDGDGFLSLSELIAQDFTWTDVLKRFQTLDTDLDGRLSQEELEAGLASWERAYIEQLFPPAGSRTAPLTFIEFRSTPLGNPFLDWRSRRRDVSGDGRLDLTEFHPNAEWPFLGLSKIYFDYLDRDGNGSLDLSELRFDVDASRVPPEELFKSLDRDGDGQLTFDEAFLSLGGNGLPPQTSGLLNPRHRRAFEAADAIRDGVIDRLEFSQTPQLIRAIASESRLRRTVQPLFVRKDTDGDGSVNREEHLNGIPPEKRAAAAYDFLLCDFDRDGRLSLLEFSCLPSVSPVESRGPVPDPVVDELERVREQVLPLFSAGERPLEDAAKRIADAVLAITTRDVLLWDSNRDGVLSAEEARRGLEIAYGLRHPEGTLLRRETGEVFDWRTFRAYNEANDGRLTRAEFEKRYWGGREKAGSVFEAADLNNDGCLTVAELASGRLFWIDSFQVFKKFDADRNGKIRLDELKTGAARWEQAYGSMSLPALDVDGDGALSFVEFRVSPFANPLADWNTRRSDIDNDGLLFLEEFHASPAVALKGLSGLYFSKLDRDGNGFLSLTEFDFRVDLRKVPDKVAFTVLDSNRDGRVSLDELAAHGRPNNADPAVVRRYEEKLGRIQEAFEAADKDRSGDLTLAEFSAPETAVAGIVSGRVTRAPSPRRLASTARSRGASEESDSGFASWRMAALVAFNVLLLAGVAWFALRSSAKS